MIIDHSHNDTCYDNCDNHLCNMGSWMNIGGVRYWSKVGPQLSGSSRWWLSQPGALDKRRECKGGHRLAQPASRFEPMAQPVNRMRFDGSTFWMRFHQTETHWYYKLCPNNSTTDQDDTWKNRRTLKSLAFCFSFFTPNDFITYYQMASLPITKTLRFCQKWKLRNNKYFLSFA